MLGPKNRAPAPVFFLGKRETYGEAHTPGLQAFYRRGLAQDALGKTQVAHG